MLYLLFLALFLSPTDDLNSLSSNNYLDRNSAQERLTKPENEELLRKAIFTSDLEKKLRIKKILEEIEKEKAWNLSELNLDGEFTDIEASAQLKDLKLSFVDKIKFKPGSLLDLNHIYISSGIQSLHINKSNYHCLQSPFICNLLSADRRYQEIITFPERQQDHKFKLNLEIQYDPRICLISYKNYGAIEFIVDNENLIFNNFEESKLVEADGCSFITQCSTNIPKMDSSVINSLKIKFDFVICTNWKNLVIADKDVENEELLVTIKKEESSTKLIVENMGLNKLCFDKMYLEIINNGQSHLEKFINFNISDNKYTKNILGKFEKVRIHYGTILDKKEFIFEFKNVPIK